MNDYDINLIINDAGAALGRIEGTQPAQEVMGYALTSIACSLFALAIANTKDETEPRGKHGLDAASQDSSKN